MGPRDIMVMLKELNDFKLDFFVSHVYVFSYTMQTVLSAPLCRQKPLG